MDINEIFNQPSAGDTIAQLKKKSIEIPSWADLEKQYNPKKHDVYTDKGYLDQVVNGQVQKVTRIGLGWQKLAVKRMTEMMFSVPVKRTYKPSNDQEKEVAKIMEKILQRARIDSVNNERGRNLFASCECLTIWNAQEVEANYGEISPLKLRCKNYSPMTGDEIYPLYDEYDDLVAISVQYTRVEDKKNVTYFDTYTADRHVRFVSRENEWEYDVEEKNVLGKIPCIYINRPEPIWEDQSDNVSELEWTLSRNGNYLRKNSRPNWVIFSDEPVTTGKESKDQASARNVMKYPANARAEYVTWNQAVDSLKFHTEFLKNNFFMQLQLPDMSMENMKATPMSGEARKMMFIDAQLKVTDESGPWLEALDREINVLRAFMKIMYPHYQEAIDALEVETEITPFNINVESERIGNLINATGGKAIMSQKTAIQNLGYVDDAEEEFEAISKEGMSDLFGEPTE